MAGVAGFEPTHDGIKTRCLTAWLHPCNLIANYSFLHGDWFNAFATNASVEVGSWAKTDSASCLEFTSKKTQAPVPVILAEPKLFSKFNELETSL